MSVLMSAYSCPVVIMWFAQAESVFCLRARMCSVYRVLKLRPVCPMQNFGQSLHFSLQTPGLLYLFVCCLLSVGCILLIVLFFVLNAILYPCFLNCWAIFCVCVLKYVSVMYLSFFFGILSQDLQNNEPTHKHLQLTASFRPTSRPIGMAHQYSLMCSSLESSEVLIFYC